MVLWKKLGVKISCQSIRRWPVAGWKAFPSRKAPCADGSRTVHFAPHTPGEKRCSSGRTWSSCCAASPPELQTKGGVIIKLSNHERETIINYNEGGGPTASVYTHSKALRRKLDKLSADRSDECRLIRTSHDGQAAEYYIPKKWIRINPREQMRERAKIAFSSRQLSRDDDT